MTAKEARALTNKRRNRPINYLRLENLVRNEARKGNDQILIDVNKENIAHQTVDVMNHFIEFGYTVKRFTDQPDNNILISW